LVLAAVASGLLASVSPCRAQPSPDPPAPEPNWDVPVVHSLGLMTAMRSAEAVIWPKSFASTDPLDWARGYGEAVGLPPRLDASASWFEWDGDDWTINGIGHGLFGSELYFRARACRCDPAEALLFASAATATWEFVFEGNAVRPSALDLWTTPIAGIALGELRYLGWRAAGGLHSATWRLVLRTVLDPLGTFERAFRIPC
jgi:hypothetical protein